MIIPVDNDIFNICNEIIAEDNTEDEWAEIESSDMFQRGKYNGGFDADDMFFGFSFNDAMHVKWCFSLTLNEVRDITEGKKVDIKVDKWDDLIKQLESE